MAYSSTDFTIQVENPGPYNGVINSVSDLNALPSGHWGEVPNSTIRGVSGVEKLPQDYADFNGTSSASFESYQGPAPGGTGGPHHVGGITAWSGGALDTTRSRLLIAGGGHSSYGGNEIYAFDIPSLSWIRLTNPYFVTSGTVPVGNPNADGSPTSRHTYGGLTYDSARDSLWMLGGAHWAANSGPSSDLWELSLGNLAAPADSPASWTQKANSASSGPSKTLSYIPSTARLVATGPTSPQWTDLYNPTTNSWTRMSNSGSGVGLDGQSALDDERQILRIKAGSLVTELNLTTSVVSKQVPQTGPIPGSNAYSFNTNAKRFVAFDGGTSVYSTARDGHSWTAHAAASGNAVTPPAITASGGTFGRFQYVPAYNVFIYMNSVDQNIFFYKL